MIRMEYNNILNENFKIKELKPKQEDIVKKVLDKKDVIGILPTGYGKSICFQLPALMFSGITLVISPLIALMQDQVINLKRKGIDACYINSSLTSEKIDDEYENIKKGKYKLIYVAGERLENKKFINLMLNLNISLITVDEAHTLLWGDSFRFSLAKIYDFIALFNYRIPILALTATASLDVLNKIKKILHLSNPIIIKTELDRKNIYYETKITKEKKKELIRYLTKHSKELGIIYCLTVKKCTEIFTYLKNLGYNVGIYHGKLSNSEKDEEINNFINDKYNIMVSTSAFGMGIDKANIRYVLNYDIPLTIEDLTQELGRCGRDGLSAVSTVFFSTEDIRTAEYLIDAQSNPNLSFKENLMLRSKSNKSLDKVIEYATTRGCLHKFILKQFGETLVGDCNNCSNCYKKYRHI